MDGRGGEGRGGDTHLRFYNAEHLWGWVGGREGVGVGGGGGGGRWVQGGQRGRHAYHFTEEPPPVVSIFEVWFGGRGGGCRGGAEEART